MNKSQKRGFGFGITSGIITTLGILVGLYSTTYSKVVVLGGIVSVAVADAFSDALGMHLSEESSGKVCHRDVWKSTFAAFFAKMFFAAIFIIPVLVFSLENAIIFSVFLGLIILGIFSYRTAKFRGESGIRKIFEHVSIAIFVVVITYFLGRVIAGI